MAFRITFHSGKGYPEHNDRSRSPSHSDKMRQKENRYMYPMRYKLDSGLVPSFRDIELKEYERLFSDYIKTKNDKARASRHLERLIDVSTLYEKNPPEEVLFYIGSSDSAPPASVLFEAFKEFQKIESEKYGSSVCFLDAALHCDETGAPHIHARYCFRASDGSPNRKKALSEIGFSVPKNEETRFHNATVLFGESRRKLFQECASRRGLEIETEPRKNNPSGLSLKQYKLIREKNRLLRGFLEENDLLPAFNKYVAENRQKTPSRTSPNLER